MKNFTCLFILIGLLGFISHKSTASHLYGGQISYVAVSPGVFVATYTNFMAPAQNIISTTVQFNLRAPGCSSGSFITANRQSSSLLDINGPGRNTCTNPAPQLLAGIYSATVVVPLGQCSEWYLSVKDCPKNDVANLQQDPNACVYVEAVINVFTGALQKNSPVFLPPTSLMFNVNAPATFSNLALQTHPETDSVEYSLKPALAEHNQPLVYTGNYTFSQPLPSATGVTLHPNTGLLTFVPNVFLNNPATPNVYTVVVEATEYRKMAGGVRKVSSTQRSIPVFITNNPGNANPDLLNVSANNQPIMPNQVVEIPAGSSLVFQINTTDADPADTLTLFLPDSQFPGFPANTAAVVTSGLRPSGTLTFNTPPANTDKLLYFPITVRDNSCPVRGVTTHIYGVRIKGSPTGRSEDLHPNRHFSAAPNPFSEQVTFRINQEVKAETILIYNLLGQQIDQIALRNLNSGNRQQIAWKKSGNYASGTYLARLVSEGKTLQTLRFIKQ